jgi:hypothetical protein
MQTAVDNVKASARKTAFGYVGRITVFGDKRRLWSRSTLITRQSRGDALHDARILAIDTIIQNVVEVQWA